MGKGESVEKGNLSRCLKVNPKVQSGDYFKTWISPEYLVNELLTFSWENSSSFQKLSQSFSDCEVVSLRKLCCQNYFN